MGKSSPRHPEILPQKRSPSLCIMGKYRENPWGSLPHVIAKYYPKAKNADLRAEKRGQYLAQGIRKKPAEAHFGAHS